VAPLEEKTGGVAKTPQAVSRQRRTWIGETDSEKCWVQFREWHPDLEVSLLDRSSSPSHRKEFASLLDPVQSRPPVDH
jgi:hypothetical protein